MSQITTGALNGLVTALRGQQTQLTDRWIQLVFGDAEVEHSDDLTYRQLADHVPRIFDEICLVLESQDMDSQEHAIEHDAREHGKWRWQQGYRIDELVRELDLFRQVLLAAIGDYAQHNPSFDRKREERARLITDQTLSFVTLTSVREAVSERDRKLDEYTGMLERANQELTFRERLISELYETRMQVARRVTHDLRNFLNVFATALQLIGRSQAKNDRAIALAKRQVTDMAALVDEMGEYSKVLGDDSILTVERFDLTDLFDELMQLCHSSAKAKGLTLKGRVDPALSMITSNRLKMKQIALNLLSNAIKYTTSGEVELAIVASAAKHWTLRVSDTGMGISEEDRERVFEEFERAASDEIPGTGLGLAIVKELARELQGVIRFESYKGRGTVFEVLFPLVLEIEGAASAD
ncbi:sensor histidine kinase [Caballeronia sordidicola]|uniref:histidine kinase n=1 Tax=Caballeronia sordidicola TaxID=196367 RepID=A0A226WTM8_CABSO|nr:sensor histidine kinase [Caballeronia sordidicola]OXC74531.1 Signal transduction histidine kinase [Caballeronia sordidicola]